MSEKVRLKRRAKGDRPYFFEDPAVDKLLSMIMALSGEVCVMRDRIDTLERLLERNGTIKLSDIDAYEPSDMVLSERATLRETFLCEVLRIVQVELDAVDEGSDAYEHVIKDISTS